jgi:hypothetical protein
MKALELLNNLGKFTDKTGKTYKKVYADYEEIILQSLLQATAYKKKVERYMELNDRLVDTEAEDLTIKEIQELWKLDKELKELSSGE